MTAFLDELAELTGEEIFNLVTELDRGWTAYTEQGAKYAGRDILPAGFTGAMLELHEVKADVLAQIARITVPMREAQGIIWRAVYARNHPVRVAGT